MGQSYSNPAPENTAQALQAYSKYLPSLSTEAENQIVPSAVQQAQASAATAPIYNQSNLENLQRFALPEAQVGQQVAESNALAGANTNLKQIEGAGGQAAKAATDLETQLSPAYAAAQKGAAEGVNAISLGGLSPGEQAATERSLDQSNIGTGNLGVLNPQNTISNALNFGGAFNSKVGLLNNATNTATNAASAGGFSPISVAMGQPATSTMGNFGTGTFTGSSPSTSAGAAGNAFNFSGGLLNNITSLSNAGTGSQAQQNTANIGANAPSAYLGSVCCFIFMEAWGYKLPECVRWGRDHYYKFNPDIATGYRRMACWLVPAMQKSKVVRFLVSVLIVCPITSHLHNLKNRERSNYKRVTHFWLKVWAFLGNGHEEVEYRKPWMYDRRWLWAK